ncbi:MAG: hypothetical protein GX638_15290, partial [Crenarchaeota archaeon]|nr:hypothetical protein [Thermoproteota archaeon]
CGLYDLKLTVKVVDYFGTPISNVIVQLSRSDTIIATLTTQNDGSVTFDDIIGSNLIITAHLADNDNSYTSKNIDLSSSTTVELAMANFVSFAGIVMGLSIFATIIILIIIIILLAIILTFKKTGFKLQYKK